MQRERHVAHARRGAQVPHLQHRRAQRGFRRAFRVDAAKVLPDHQPDDVGLRQAAGGQRPCHRAPLAHHRHPVGDGEHFLQPVRDEYQRAAGGTQPRHHVEQPLHLTGAERGGGFVEDNERGVHRQRLADFHQLALRHRQPVHLEIERKRGLLAETVEDAARALPQRGVAQPPGQREFRQEEVFQNRKVRRETGFLHHHGDAGGQRIARAARIERRAAPHQRAAVAPHMPADDARQRGLAGPVRAQQAMHLTRGDLHAGTGQGAGAGEALFDVGRQQQRPRRRIAARRGRRHQVSSLANTVCLMVGNSSARFVLVTVRIGTEVSFGTLSPFRCASSASADFSPIR